MEALKVKSGSIPQGTLATGRTIAKKGLEYSFTRMETSTKVCGEQIRDTDKGHTGETKEEN